MPSYEIMWKNKVESRWAADGNIIRRTPGNAGENTDAYSWYVILIIFNSSTKYFVARQQSEGSNCSIFLAALNTFILLTVTCTPTTIKRERTVACYAKTP